MHRRKQLTLLINYDTVKYMNKIQTMWSDLKDWFYNASKLNVIAVLVNDLQDKVIYLLGNDDEMDEFIFDLSQRVDFLEKLEKARQLESLLKATDASIKKSSKTKKVGKSKKAKETKRQ